MLVKRVIKLGVFLTSLFLVFGCGGGGAGATGTNTTSGSTGIPTSTSTLRAVSTGDVDLLLTSIASSGKKSKSNKSRRTKEKLDSSSFEDKKCLIFLALLSDAKYKDLVGIIKTNDKGGYELKTEDVFAYLKVHFADVGETADFATLDATLDVNRDRILAAFKKLGVLRLRAFYNDGEKVVSMEFFQNVTESDPKVVENADPRNRIIAHWVEKIFKDLGIIPTGEQYASLEKEIESISDEVLSGFELPEGVTLEQFTNAYKGENLVILTEDQKALILSILASATESLTQAEKDSLALAGGVPTETVTDPISNGVDQDMTGLINSLGDQIQKIIEEVLADPTKNPAFAKLLTTEGSELDTTSTTFKTDFGFDSKSKESLIRFFIALGFPVEVEETEATSEPLIAIAIPLPSNILEENLPGKKYFGDRNIRVFKVSDIATLVTTANGLFTGQTEVDTLGISNINTLSEADFLRLERLRVLHGFIRHLKRSPPIVSHQLISTLVTYSGTVKLNEVATIVSNYFIWRQESITLVDDGKGNTKPVFTGGLVPPSTGEDVSDSEILRKLGVQLGADPITAVDSLTTSDGFLFQFIGGAIQEAVNRSNAEKKIFNFPKTIEDARVLIRGSNAYRSARDAVGRGLIAAFPPFTDANSLYGKLLDGETSLNAKSAIFFVVYLFHSKFQIDSTLSYLEENTLRPRLDNDKFLTAKDEENFTLVKFVTSLLSISEFSELSNFTDAENLVRALGEDTGLDSLLYDLPEFKENEIPSDVNKKANIAASVTFEFFDKRSVTTISSTVSASAVPVKFGPNGPEIGDGAAVVGVIEAIVGSTTQWKIVFSNVPSGQQYLVAISVTGYTNDVPDLFFFADGFADPLDITKGRTFIIPPDEETFIVPCLGMLANQQGPSTGAIVDLMGIDFSNFEAGLPFLLPISKDGKDGYVDLRFALLTSGQFSLETSFPNLSISATDSTPLIAPLFVNWTGTAPTLGLKLATGFERLSNPNKALGLNFLTLISGLVAGDMTNQAILTDKSSDSIKTFFKDGPPLYLLKDRKGIFWVIAVKTIDSSVAPGFADLCFVRIGVDGKIQVPELRKQNVDLNSPNPTVFINLHYGDFAYFPSTTTGGIDLGRWELSAPKQAPFGFNSVVAAKAQIRYAGEDLTNRVGTGSATELLALSNYIKAGDFTDIPSRLDYYGPTGGGLAVIKFDSATFTWPSAASATFATSVSSLTTGDLVLIRFKSTGDADLIGMVDKKANNPAQDNFKIGLAVANFADPKVQALGVLVDADQDGYISKFDPNDNDENIKPNLLDPKPKSQDGSSLAGPSQVTGIFASENGSKFIFVEMQENMDEVYQISVAISVKHSDGSIETFPAVKEVNLFEITPAVFTATSTNAGPTGVVKTGTLVTLQGVSFNNLNFKLTTSPTMFDAGGTFAPDSKVSFEYEFKFRPRNPTTGLPISDVSLFGTNVARPNIKGISELIIPALTSQVGSFDKTAVLIQIGSELPKTMADSTRLEPQKDTILTWGAVTNASFYEISVSFDSISSGTVFLPNFRQNFMTDGVNRKVIIPAFMLPQGRSSGRLEIIARRKNALGQPTFDGTVISYSSLSTNGESSSTTQPNGGVNDIKLIAGDALYYHADTKKIDSIASGGQKLFTITPSGTTAQLVLAPTISAEGFLTGPTSPKKSKIIEKSLKDTVAIGSTVTVTPGAFLTFKGILLSDGSGQPIDVNFSGFRTDGVVVQAFLPPPFKDVSAGGNFDVNNDLITDVVFNGTTTLTFTLGIKVTKQDALLGPVLISTAAVATIYSIPVGSTRLDFELELSTGKRYWFSLDITAKSVQWGEIFGAATPPPVSGSLFSGTLLAGKILAFDSATSTFVITTSTTTKDMINFSGTVIASFNGWALSHFEAGVSVPDTSVTPALNSPKVYRVTKTTPNMSFDLELTLFATGELTVKVTPPSNSAGSTTPPPASDPFTTNTFVFNSLMSNGQFMSVTSATPFTFSVSAVSGANTALSFSGSILLPAAGWVLYNELNAVLPSLTPTVGNVNFFRVENTTVGVAFSGFVKLESANAKIGILNVNSIGNVTPPPPFTGLFQGTMAVDKYLTVNDNGTTASFFIAATSSSTLQQFSLLKFTVTNEVMPQNGGLIEIFNGSAYVPAVGQVIATSAKLSTRFTHPTDLRVFYIDFKTINLDLGVQVISMTRGTPPPPVLPGILVGSGQNFNRVAGVPTTFALSLTVDTNPLVSESIATLNSGVVTGLGLWQIYDIGSVLMPSGVTPTVGGFEIFIKSSNVAILEAYKVKVTLDGSAVKVAFEVKQIIVVTPPPPPGTDVGVGKFFNYKPGAPATFVTSATSIILPGEESLFQFSAGQIIQANGWNAFDSLGATPVTLPFTPTVAVTTLVFKKSGAQIKLDVKLTAPSLNVMVVNVIPALPPPPFVDVLDTNYFKFIRGAPPSFMSSPTTIISVPEETVFKFNASQIFQDNGWSAFDSSGVTPVTLPFTATVAVTTLVFKKATTIIKVDVNLAAPNLHVVIVNVVP